MRKVQKMIKNKMYAVLTVVCVMVSLCGCGGSASSFDSVASMETANDMADSNWGGGYYDEEWVAEETIETEAEITELDENVVVSDNRKLIKTVDMRVETKEFDQVMVTLEDEIASLGGYIENSEIYNGSSFSDYRSERSASLTIRIPKQRLEEFLETVSGIVNVVRCSENVDDVTLAYVDVESHKNALQTEQTRLLELLEMAETVDDILRIEERLSSVRYQLESMESQLRTYDNKIDYSTVYLDVEEVHELTPVTEETTWERIAGGFLESIENIVTGLKELLIWFIVHSPYFILYALFVGVIVLIIKVVEKKKKAKRNQNTNQKPKQ